MQRRRQGTKIQQLGSATRDHVRTRMIELHCSTDPRGAAPSPLAPFKGPGHSVSTQVDRRHCYPRHSLVRLRAQVSKTYARGRRSDRTQVERSGCGSELSFCGAESAVVQGWQPAAKVSALTEPSISELLSDLLPTGIQVIGIGSGRRAKGKLRLGLVPLATPICPPPLSDRCASCLPAPWSDLDRGRRRA